MARGRTRGAAAGGAVCLLAAALAASAAPAAAYGTATERVSVASDGTQSAGTSRGADVSADGTVVAFSSNATDLTADANSQWSIYVRDRAAGTTEQASVAGAGSSTPGAANNQSAGDPSISGDGRFVAFRSLADNLVEDDSGFGQDVFVHDRDNGTTTLITRSVVTGAPANGRSDDPEISADGRHVVFSSSATDLVAGDTNGVVDVFVHHLDTGVTELVSTAPDGTQGSSASSDPAVNGDGSVVAFATTNDFDPADTDGTSRDVYVRDFTAGTTELVSGPTSGLAWNVQSSSALDSPVISGDGQHVGFMTSFVAWVRLRDESRTVLASDNRGRLEAGRMSDDGRYYVQWEYATGCSVCSWYPWLFDLDTGDRVNVGLTQTGAVSDVGAATATDRPGISADGAVVGFHSAGTDLVAGDTNGTADVFVRLRDAPVDAVGPVVVGAAATPPTAAEGNDVIVDATVDDTGTGGSAVSAAEVSVDAGSWEPMTATDGTFDGVVEDVRHVIATPAVGPHEACVRGTDAAGNVGAPACVSFVVEAATLEPPVIDPIADRSAFVGEEVRFTATATDPDGDDTAIEWSLGPTPPPEAAIGSSTGTFSWTPTTTVSFSIEVVATDADGLTDTEAFAIGVSERPATEPIVFSSDRDGDRDLWSVSPSGGAPVQLADLDGDDDFPRWSPDGTQVAFVKNQNTNVGRLWLIGADGSGATQLSSLQARFAPAWSPDGTEIYFAANSGDGDFDVHGVAPDGTGLRKIADTPENESYVAWVGEHLAVDRGSDLVLVDPATGADTGSFPVGNAVGYDGEPGGDRVALAQTTAMGPRIVVLDTVSGAITPVTDGSFGDTSPAWAPDATSLVFARRGLDAGENDLFTIGVDGSAPTQLTTDLAADSAPTWFGTTTTPPPPTTITVSLGERIGVADGIVAIPGVQVTIGEGIGVTDDVRVMPAVLVTIGESIGVTDGATTALPLEVFIGEGIGVSDGVVVVPAVEIVIGERVGVADGVSARDPFAGISTTELAPGGFVEVSGTGFGPGTSIEIGLLSEFLLLDTVIADEAGSFRTTVEIPAPDELPEGFAGEHTLVARGADPHGDAYQVEFAVTVLAPVDVDLAARNPRILVDTDDGTFTMSVTLSQAWADLTEQVPDPTDLSIELAPVGSGPTLGGECEAREFPGRRPFIGPGPFFPRAESWRLEMVCAFEHAAVEANTYAVIATVSDDVPLFTGRDDSILTVVAAGDGSAPGDGWFLWPGAVGR